MPKILCKAYIDFEVQEAGRAIARSLCERLVALSGDVEAWILYALFEEEAISLLRTDREEEDEEDEEKEVEMVPGKPALVRQVFGRGYKNLKRKNRWRVALLEVWKNFAQKNGSPGEVEGLMLIVTKKQARW